jgi:hypothetical protein
VPFTWPPSTAALLAVMQADFSAAFAAIEANAAAIEANKAAIEANTKLLKEIIAILNRPTTLGLNLEAGTFKHQPVPTKKGP